mmetsp:Transcript_29959/g.60116  ORF Transcript_29959/g.60116 Transcript_29959/m.60116 type:complete len:310 (-) Transcript_29959:205-1134(-)
MVKIMSASNTEELSQAACKFVATESGSALRSRGKFVVALSGGSMPALLTPLKSTIPRTDWANWHVFFADERCVPLDHNDSNFKACKDFLTLIPPEQVHQLPLASASIEDPAALASDYEGELRTACGACDGSIPVFDLVLLGMGPDGHTASLFPGHDLLSLVPGPDRKADTIPAVIEILDSPKPPSSRITLTLPVLNASRAVAFIAAGASKAPVLMECFQEDEGELTLNKSSSYPCSMVDPSSGRLTWFVDAAAASELPRSSLNSLAPSAGDTESEAQGSGESSAQGAAEISTQDADASELAGASEASAS